MQDVLLCVGINSCNVTVMYYIHDKTQHAVGAFWTRQQ